MPFDPARALAYAEGLARPRLVGTAANDAVIAELASRLQMFGCQVEVAPVEFSSAGDRALVWFVLAAQVLLLLTFWVWSLNAAAAIVPAALLTFQLLTSGRWYRAAARASLGPFEPGRSGVHGWWLRLGRTQRTANVVAHIPARPGAPPAPPFLLVAHSDSKSQAVSLPARMGLVAAGSLTAIVFAGLSVLRVFAPGVTPAAAIAGLAALLSGVPLVFVLLAESGNASPGAIDNASGAGLVLHLAECLSVQPAARPVTVLITGAEEWGLFGALAYVRDIGLPALRGATVLNFDGVGTTGRLAMVGGGGRLEGAVRAACQQRHIPLGRVPLVGAQFDHLPFADSGLDALTLVSIGRAVWQVHTPGDDIDLLSIEGFRQAGAVALAVVDALSE